MTADARDVRADAMAALRAGDGYAALSHYARLVADAAPKAVDCELPHETATPAARWVRRLLLLAAAGGGSEAAREEVAAAAMGLPSPLQRPVCMVVGTTDPSLALEDAAALLTTAFAGFGGTVISGGTDQGAAGLVATLGEVHPDLTTVGYAPRSAASLDRRYHHLHLTDGDDFSPWEALQGWTDVIAAGVSPGDVTVLGLGGGRISSAEYRIALALGATVGIVAHLGRAGTELLADATWSGHPHLVHLRWDADDLGRFFGRS